MLSTIPNNKELSDLVGTELFEIWQNLKVLITSKYEMEETWNSGGKKWTYEYKYRRGGKTLCALYAKAHFIGLMIIFGKAEREKFETIRNTLSSDICRTYDEAHTYHDGKWVMFEPNDTSLFDDYLKLLEIKRKANRK